MFKGDIEQTLNQLRETVGCLLGEYPMSVYLCYLCIPTSSKPAGYAKKQNRKRESNTLTFGWGDSRPFLYLSLHVYLYIYIYMYICINVYIYI